jgi:DNA-binding beta-propeller fold protein YncE
MTPILSALAMLIAGSIPLPGGPPVGMDFLTYDHTNNRIWVPAGNTGNVDVIDVGTRKVTTLGGLATAPPRRPGRPRMGPSSAAVADGAVWIGNRGDNRLLGFDAGTLAAKGSVQLPAMPDALAYVAHAHELWATTPSERSITVVSLSGGAPLVAASIKLDGSPECEAVDDAHGVLFTNLEDKDRTLAIDVSTRKVVANWPAGCGAEGPRGLALDGPRRLLFVACTGGVGVLDLAHDGKAVGRLKTGGGVDDIAYDAQKRRLFVASSKDGTLTIAHVSDSGAIDLVATLPTAPGARNPVLDASGTLFVEDSGRGQLLIIDPNVPNVPAPTGVTMDVTMKEEKPGLLAKTKVTPDAATATAKARLPRARLVASEIEQEHGKLIYSFDFETEGASGSDEVAVDALTGKVLSVSHETPEDEAREKAADAKAAAKAARKPH